MAFKFKEIRVYPKFQILILKPFIFRNLCLSGRECILTTVFLDSGEGLNFVTPLSGGVGGG